MIEARQVTLTYQHPAQIKSDRSCEELEEAWSREEWRGTGGGRTRGSRRVEEIKECTREEVEKRQ